MSRITVSQIITEASARYGISARDLTGPSRIQRFSQPRQEIMTAIYRAGDRSTIEIGRRFGGRDHTTVLHAIRVVAEREAKCTETTERVASLKDYIKQNNLPEFHRHYSLQWYSRYRGAGAIQQVAREVK